MKRLWFIVVFLLGTLPAVAHGDELDVTEIIYEHTGDAYSWPLFSWGDREVSLPLPLIVRSADGVWQCFLSSELPCRGFAIAGEGEEYAGKVVELTPDGPVRPLDLSITRNVLSLLMSSALLVLLVLLCARWYRRHDVLKEAPSGIAALLEPLIVWVEDEIVKDAIGPDYKRYSPYLLTAFFFILLNNLLGILPFFPGGANLTGNIAVTLVLALCTFLATNLFGNRHYWKETLWPDVPVFLKAPLPLMPLIEIVGLFTKPFSLMIRLFANIFAGHAMLIGLLCVIFVTAKMGAVINGSMMAVSVLLGVFMDCLEVLVAFIQAYVFTMLSAVFIGASRQTNH
jgi:F-type H+-transporting ATPase subunit a